MNKVTCHITKKEFDTADYPIEGLDFANNPTLPEISLSQFTSRF